MKFAIDLADIAELGTQVATSGAMRFAEVAQDQVFEYVIAVATLVYELNQ